VKRLFALMGIVGALVIVSSASGAKPASNWSVKPTKLNFGSVPSGGGQGILPVTVTNTSSATEQVAGWTAVSGDEADFAVQGSSSCLFPNPPVSVAPGGSCELDFAFNPQTAGKFNATFQIDLNPGPPVLISLSGRGT
jgi:HYDIN/CFA65/VesB family protein